MTISEVYKEYVEKGKTEDEAAGIWANSIRIFN